ncbi:MAG: O-antigen translocase [Leeuwenhoekiella sp.]
MLKYLRQLVGGNILLKITSYNAFAMIVKIVSGLVSSKVIAFYLGPPGMALLGDLRNFFSSVQSVSTLGIYDGVVKYIAEYKESRKELKKILSTAFYLGFIASILTAIVLYFGASYWNTVIFKDEYDFTYIFQLMALVIPLYAINIFCIAIINGYSKYKFIIQLNIATNILGVILTVILIATHDIDGAFVAAVLLPALTLIITGVFLVKKKNFIKHIKFARVKTEYIKRFASYTGMTIFSTMSVPWVYISIRQHIIDTDGIQNAGYWDAMLRLSDYYLMFVTTILTIYILPKLSKLKSARGFRTEIFNFYKTILPLFGLGLLLIYFLRNIIIRLIFTPDFLVMEPIFSWQLLGDLIRVASVVLGYQFIAKNMFWHFIITQIISLSVIYSTSVYFIDRFGFVGASMGHAVSYAFHLSMMLFIFRKELFFKLPQES